MLQNISLSDAQGMQSREVTTAKNHSCS